MAVLLFLFSCSEKQAAEDEESRAFFKPDHQYTYTVIARDSVGAQLPTTQATLFMLLPEDQANPNPEHVTEEAYTLKGYWKTDSFVDTVDAQISSNEQTYTLSFPSLHADDFVAYTLPLEVDWEMLPQAQQTRLVQNLTEGKLHRGKSYSIRRAITYFENETLKLGKQQYPLSRKIQAVDDGPIGPVTITYWVHPEHGFVQAVYQHALGERTFIIQQ